MPKTIQSIYKNPYKKNPVYKGSFLYYEGGL